MSSARMHSKRVAIEIRKHSWAVTCAADKKPSYEHLTASNMFILLEWATDGGSAMRLSIVQGTTVIVGSHQVGVRIGTD